MEQSYVFDTLFIAGFYYPEYIFCVVKCGSPFYHLIQKINPFGEL